MMFYRYTASKNNVILFQWSNKTKNRNHSLFFFVCDLKEAITLSSCLILREYKEKREITCRVHARYCKHADTSSGVNVADTVVPRSNKLQRRLE